LAETKVRIVAEFPADTYPPITYPVAVTTHGAADAQKFLDFVRSGRAAQIFRKYGFEPLRQ
jgi:molybdate transport system substrate-binding protein